MKIIRPIRPDDYEGFEKLAFYSTVGITSLPKDPKLLHGKISQSMEAFDEKKVDPHHHLYIFVMEDLETKAILGTCGIRARTAIDEPLISYRIEDDPIQVLCPIEHHDGPSEVCGLFLNPEFRKSHLGHLLSYSRFLFMASHPSRFTEIVFAEMRGYFDENNECVFWNGVGRHFHDVDFLKVNDQRIRSKEFIRDILPKYPIYSDLLPQEVQNVIGKTHPHTEPALNLLLKIGFSMTDEVDVIDAGPKIVAPLNELIPVKESEVKPVSNISADLPEGRWIIANTKIDYRASVGQLQETADGVAVQENMLQALEIETGDHVRYFKL